MRLIPGKTKVSVELFRGVTLGDIIVCGVAMGMLILVLVSNLPWKLGICITIAIIVALLLLRLDEQPNYIYLLHILSFFGYDRRFGRTLNDKLLVEAGEGTLKDVAFDVVFKDRPESLEELEETKKLTKAEKRSKLKAQKAAAKAAKSAKPGNDKRARRREDRLLNSRRTPEEVKQEILARREERAQAELMESISAVVSDNNGAGSMSKRELNRIRKEEDRILKSKTASDEEKEAIRARRSEAGQESMRKAAQAKEASASRKPMSDIISFTGIKDGYIEYLNRSYYGAVLEIDPVEFRFFSEHRRDNSIENCLGRILRSIHAGYSANIVKLERPIMYDSYLEQEYNKLDDLRLSYENGVLSESELQSRVEIEYDRIEELNSFCEDNKVIAPCYYLVLFESDKRQLDIQIRDAEQLLKNGEMTVRRLDDRALAVFLKYTNQIDFDERDVEKIRPEDLHIWAQPETVDIRVRRVEVNHIVTHNFRVVNYPTSVGDAWLAGVMSIPGTKVVVKCRPMDRAKAIRNIDRSLQELRGQWSDTSVDSRRLEIETHLETLQELLTTLQSDSESLLECNIYITAYDIVSTRSNLRIPQPPASELPTVNEMKKNIRRSWQESGFRLNNMEFDQVQAFIGSQISALDPLAKEGRGIASNTIAACFPWVFAHISDEGGVKLGESDGIPVFIDFFRRDSERVNSNLVIVGKSGSGKSYATKSLLANLAAEDAKIFILDPENEYSELAANLHGQIINVGNARFGRLNPFHIITALDDDEAGESGPSGSYATHLQFLEEFFHQIMPDCESDALEYLNTLVDHMYLTRDITSETDLSQLRPEDYPIFDDLYDQVLQEFQSSDNPFTRDLLRTLMNYIAKFSSGGRNANIWNGPSTVTTDENFTVFNFQSMLANRNQTIANAQMLLVLKYIDNEIIKNRDYNTKYHAKRKIVVVIDEAHVFIDAKYPIALDFMFQLAKRIRKYNGMQIVITQNIKDFVGSEELARKSTAIINACQYSFIFALAPNDIQDLVRLYENAGGINESEQEQIVQAPRGQAFAIMSPSSRSTFQVDTAQGITEMFEEREYQSRYFFGEQGAEYWEDFVAESREKHEENYVDRRRQDLLTDGEDEENGSRVILNIYDEDEYAAYEEQEESSGVTFTVRDEDEENEDEAPNGADSAVRTPTGGVSLDRIGDEAVFGKIASALSRMADAAERGGAAAVSIPAYAPAEDSGAAAPEDAMTAALERKLREMDERIRSLQAENERLRTGAPETAPEAEQDLSEPDFEEEPPYEEPEPEELGPFDGLDDDAYPEEEDGELVALFQETEDYREDEEDDDFDLDEETEDEDEEYGDEDEDEDDDEDYDEDEDETEEDEDEDSSEDDSDFMSAFCSFAASLMNMTAFERMRANGKEVMTISFEDLSAEVKAQAEQKRRERERAAFGTD